MAAEVNKTSTGQLCSAVKIITRTTQSNAKLAKEQATGVGLVSVIYKALRDHADVTTKQLEQGSSELLKLHRMIDSLRIRTDGVLQARLASSEAHRRTTAATVICSQPLAPGY